jgi:cobalt-zinc-cadmium efflux system outer membrane protein
MRMALAFLIGALSGTSASAAPITFNAALDAAASGPSVAARSGAVDAARSAAVPARQLPDPKLELGLKDFPVDGPNAGSFTRDNFTMQTIGVSQAVPSIAKRRAQAGRAATDVAAAEAARSVEERSVRVATALAWVDLHFAERRLALLDRLDAGIAAMVKTAPARLAAGKARPALLLEPRQLAAELGDRRASIVAEVMKARIALTRWTGDPSPLAIGPVPSWSVEPAALRGSLGNLPVLRAADAATAQADADVRLAQAAKHPDWEVDASYGRREPRYGDLVSVGVRVDLPLFARRRQDPLIAARASDARRARLDREAAEREQVAALESALADHAMHHDRYVRAQQVLAPLAQERAALDRASYAAGTADLGMTLETALAAIRADLDAVDREAEVVRDGVRINLTYGDGR